MTIAAQAKETSGTAELAHPAVAEILGRVPLLVWATDSDLRITWIRGGAIRMLGIDLLCTPGATVESVFDTADASIVECHRRALGGESHTIEIDWRNRTPVMWIEPLRDEHGAIVGVIGIARDATEEASASRALMQHDTYDPLTGMLTRSRFCERVALQLLRAGRASTELSVVYLDVDGFGSINDMYGSASADEVLRIVATRLGEACPEPAVIGRVGADEFAVVVPGASPTLLDSICRTIHRELETPLSVSGRMLAVAASIGTASFPSDGGSIEQLLRGASAAARHANALGGNQSHVFSAAMTLRTIERVQIEHDLRAAFEHGDFFLTYQPQINIADGSLIGVEVLLRWLKDGDVIPAWSFIRHVEESSLIVPIGEWVVDRALHQLKLWHDAGLDPGRVAINIGARQLANDSIVTAIRRGLETYELQGHAIEVEITETAAMQSLETTSHLIDELRALGVEVTIDDFGTGYSSLNYLKRFAVTGLKIDRSFTADLPDSQTAAAIVSAIINTAQALGVRVVAEGVENERQADHLRAAGCAEAQGFLYSRPLTAETMTDYLKRPAARPPARLL